METKGKANREFWKSRVEAQARSGLTHQAYCNYERITVSAFRYWKKRLAKESAAGAGFVEIAPAGHPRTGAGDSSGVVRLVLPSGVSIEVSALTDLTLLTRVIATLVNSR